MTARREHTKRLVVVWVVALAAAGCGGGSGAPRSEATETTSTAAVPTSGSPTDSPVAADPAVVDSGVVAGWLAYDVLDGWEVSTEAEGLLGWEEDLDGQAYEVDVESLDVMVSLERSDGSARVTVAREPRYLRVPDVKAWADDLLAVLAEPGEEVVSDGPVELPHGRARRVVLRGPTSTRVVATTAFGEQRIVLEALTGVEPEAVAEVDQVLGGIVLDAEVTVTPLLHYFPALAWVNVDGERAVEVDVRVPSDWTQRDEPPVVAYRSPDGEVTATITFEHRDGRSAEEALREALADPGEGWDPLAQAEHRDVGGRRAAVARMAPASLDDYDLATTWVVVAEVGEHMVKVVLDSRRGEEDVPLLQAMFASLAFRGA